MEREEKGSRVEGVGLQGWGGEGGRAERGQGRRGWVPVWGRWRSVFQMCLCVSSVNQPSVSVCAQWGNSSWTFLNQVSVRRHLGYISSGGRIDSRAGFTAQKTQYVQRRHRQTVQRKCVLLNWFGRRRSHFLRSLAILLFTLMTNQHYKNKHTDVFAPIIRFRWCNQPFSQPEDSLTMNREKRRGKEERERGGGEAAIRTGLAAIKTHFSISHFMQKGKTRCSIKPHAYCFIFHLHPSQCFSAQTFCVPSLFPHAILLLFFPLSPCHSSSLLPLRCLLSNWYERVTPGPSGVKWYKVIGRSSPLTGWPLKGLLEGANQVLFLPP